MVEQEKNTKVNITLCLILPVSLQGLLCLALPILVGFCLGYSHSRSTFCFSSLQLLQAIGGCSLLPWPCLGSFLSDWALGPLPLLYSLVCLISCLWTALMGHLGLRWKPQQEREQEMSLLGSLPSFVTASRGSKSYTRVLLRYLSQILS